METGLFRKWLTVNLLAWVSFSVAADLVRPISVIDPSLEPSIGGAGDSYSPIISPDGRYVLFASTANNLSLNTNGTPIPGTFPARFNVYLRDRANETTIIVSANQTGTGGGNGDSIPTGLSTNGVYALFESTASNLVPNDTNNLSDIFVRDLVNGTNILVNAKAVQTPAVGTCRGSVMTPGGRYVAFVSAANNLVLGDTNGIPDVFVRDLQSGTTVLVSVGATATNVYTSSSESPAISDDGRYVAFYSTATNLISGVTNVGEIYVRDLVGNTTFMASTNARAALFSVSGNSNAISYNHALSADGRFVAYAASHISTNQFTGIILRHDLDTGLTDLVYTNALMPYGPRENIRTLDMTPNGRFIAFLANSKTNNFTTGTVPSVRVWDSQAGTSVLASVNITNGVAFGNFECPAIDTSGRFVAFTSTATDLSTNPPDFRPHVFVRDLQLNQTILVDVDTNGIGFGVAANSVPGISANGRFVAFQGFDPQSSAANSRRNYEVFTRDLETNTVELISVRHPALGNFSADGRSDLSTVSVSGNGRYITFASLASNLMTNDSNFNRDVFVRDLFGQTNMLASIGTNGFSAAGMSFEPAISADGRFVAFTSSASNLAANDNNNLNDVFVFDLQTRIMNLGSIATTGVSGNNSSFSPVISRNGAFLFFRSKASNLAPGAFTNENLFWRNLQTSTTVALSTNGLFGAAVTADGRYAAYRPTTINSLYIWDSMAGGRVYTNSSFFNVVVAISPDGRRVASTSGSQLHVLDWLANTNRLIGALSAVSRAGIKFSADGQFLTYASATAQAGTDTNGTYDVFLYNFQTQIKTLVSRAHNFSHAANGASDFPDISQDGRFIAYRSAATNIVPNDTNGWPDVFIYDQQLETSRLLSANESGKSGNNRSYAPVFSGDGRSLVFPSWASDLVGNDFNQSGDLFGFAFLYATITRGAGQSPVISWPATSGQNYQVQFKNNVDDAIWQTVSGTITLTGNQASMQDFSPNASHRIYRVVAF